MDWQWKISGLEVIEIHQNFPKRQKGFVIRKYVENSEQDQENDVKQSVWFVGVIMYRTGLVSTK